MATKPTNPAKAQQYGIDWLYFAPSVSLRLVRSGDVDEIRQPSIQSSEYQKQLDEEIEEEHSDYRSRADSRDVALETPVLRANEVRYWSDFSRVFYLPRSLHQLPDVLDFENSEEDWAEGRTMFERYDAVRL